MNRATLARDLLVLEQVAKKAYAQAARLREQLEADARAEFAEQGTAPSWNMPDLGRLVLPVTKDAVYVEDEDALIGWLRDNRPNALTTAIRQASLKSLLSIVEHDGGHAYLPVEDPDTADIPTPIPGLAVRPGGAPKTLTFTPIREATAVVGRAADEILGKVAAELGVTLPDGPTVTA